MMKFGASLRVAIPIFQHLGPLNRHRVSTHCGEVTGHLPQVEEKEPEEKLEEGNEKPEARAGLSQAGQ